MNAISGWGIAFQPSGPCQAQAASRHVSEQIKLPKKGPKKVSGTFYSFGPIPSSSSPPITRDRVPHTLFWALFLSCAQTTDFILAWQTEGVQGAGVLLGKESLEVRRSEQGVARARVDAA